MKPYKGISAGLLAVWTACALALTASANSSWHWISSTRPFDLLPLVMAVTLAIETVALTHIAQVRPTGRVLCIVLLANSLSFAVPYILVDPAPYSYSQLLEHYPVYTVGIAYLIATLLVELPAIWLTLRKNTDRPMRLVLTALGANVVTTLITALAERLFCRGSW